MNITRHPEELYFTYLGYILHKTVLDTLKSLKRPLRAVVVGGKALNAFLKPEYQLTSPDWDMNVWNSSNLDDSSVRDEIGQMLAERLQATVEQQRFRIDLLDEYFDLHLERVEYSVNPRPFVHSITGEEFLVAHVNLIVRGLQWPEALIDLLHLPHPERDYVNLNGVNYLNAESGVQQIRDLLDLPTYSKRDRALDKIRLFEEAVADGGLSCNWYRYQYAQTPDAALRSQLASCIADTAMGVPDTILMPQVNPYQLRRRFHVGRADILRHHLYALFLSARVQNVLAQYTKLESVSINLRLLNHFLLNTAAPVPAEARLLQRVVLHAPPLQRDAIVYKLGRFMFYQGQTNYGWQVGDVVQQYTFNSTTFDNYLDFQPFIDEGLPCCAFVIRIPRGSRVFIVGRQSSYPAEAEVLLPFGCSLRIDGKQTQNVTYKGQTRRLGVVYNTMTVYRATYVPPRTAEIAEFAPPPYADLSSLKTKQHEQYAESVPDLQNLLAYLFWKRLNTAPSTQRTTSTGKQVDGRKSCSSCF